MTVVALMGAYNWPSTENQKKSKDKHTWTAAEIVMLIFVIIYFIFWLLMIISSFTCTANRGMSEKLFSIFEALVLPEVWLFQHGINASQQQVSFFGALPKI